MTQPIYDPTRPFATPTGENGNSQEDSFNIIKGFLYISKKKKGLSLQP